ncbi:hypothetical protein X777_11629 [Ooceraea biroi]|uniref:Uncharacterized protein n=1 Tax=Ooceraea biroi TaxID=2015173 RepID=A0A026W116_OOCBI|nr:hypothetical protein X777_11629 [Ooceraea biroi]
MPACAVEGMLPYISDSNKRGIRKTARAPDKLKALTKIAIRKRKPDIPGSFSPKLNKTADVNVWRDGS